MFNLELATQQPKALSTHQSTSIGPTTAVAASRMLPKATSSSCLCNGLGEGAVVVCWQRCVGVLEPTQGGSVE